MGRLKEIFRFEKIRHPRMTAREYIFLRDVFFISISAFGGPQAHIAMFFDVFVNKQRYITEKDLIELNALCQILPGPTSTQTLTAIGFRKGGPKLAFLTLLVWVLPAVSIMTAFGIGMSYMSSQGMDLSFTKFISPMAVSFVAFAALRISKKVITGTRGVVIALLSAVISYFLNSPWAFPVVLIAGGLVTSSDYRNLEVEDCGGEPFHVDWANFILFMGVAFGLAILGGITQWRLIRLFENFYRNGSLIFGGGQVLVPALYNEFVSFKEYLTPEEFMSGYSFAQAIPGPVFSFSAYVGVLSMKDYGILGELLGALVASLGIFLPGTFLIFFIIRFWERLKKYRLVKASLDGINAASSGLVIAAAFMLFTKVEASSTNYGIIAATFLLLQFTKIPAPYIILSGFGLGFVI